MLTVRSFAQLLKDNYTGRLDSEADQYLNYMLQASNRMMELTKGLLEYSRIGVVGKLVLVACNLILGTVINDFDIKIRESNATIEFENLPTINGYGQELHVLFQNLISNALKFRKRDMPLVISISSQRESGNWLFKVSDNGIGIPEKDIDEIFVIFKRLHDRTEIEGNGIGLAHCKKIVELHGGSIWVESTFGHGSTFYFTLAV